MRVCVCMHMCGVCVCMRACVDSGQESRTDTLMPSLKAIPHLSHLMGLASP